MQSADSAKPLLHRWSVIIAALGLLVAVPGAVLAFLRIVDIDPDDDDRKTGGFDPEELFVSRPDVTAGELVGTYRFVDVDDEMFVHTFPDDIPEDMLSMMREELKSKLREGSRIRIEADEFIHATRCEDETLFVRDPAAIDPSAMTINLDEARTENTVQSDGTSCSAGFDGVTTFTYALDGVDLTLTLPEGGSFYLQKASD